MDTATLRVIGLEPGEARFVAMKQRAHVRLPRRAMQTALLTLIATSCNGLGSGQAAWAAEDSLMHTSKQASGVPDVRAFTSSPLRNLIRVELTAPVPEVWNLVGDLSRFPEYSTGLERVEEKRDASGALTEYVCHFKPREEGAVRIVHRELTRWYETNRGYASSAEEGNAFGLTNDLNLVTIEPSKHGTILTWAEYYDAQDLDASKTSYDEALADIGENLICRFGGKVIDRFVEQSR